MRGEADCGAAARDRARQEVNEVADEVGMMMGESKNRLQGLPENFLEDSPFTRRGKFTVVGNGVPLHLGRAVARAIQAALIRRDA